LRGKGFTCRISDSLTATQGVSFFNMKLKCGAVREDGMVFWRYNKKSKNGQYWITKEKYEEIKRKERERSRKRRKKDPTIHRSYNKKWYEKNKEHKLKKCKEYRDANRELYRDNLRRRRKENPLYRCSSGIRSLIIGCMRNGGFKKSTKTAEILGCSFEEFKAHLESQFLPGMSWDNRSEWHIDHIMPVSMAKTYDEIVRLNHYRNLRPIWARDNQSKANKTPDTLVLF